MDREMVELRVLVVQSNWRFDRLDAQNARNGHLAVQVDGSRATVDRFNATLVKGRARRPSAIMPLTMVRSSSSDPTGGRRQMSGTAER
jgi:hypothetical protein